MRYLIDHSPSVRTLGAVLAAAPVVLSLLVAGLYRGAASDLTPLALILPLLSMGVLDGILEHRASEQPAHPPTSERERGRAEAGRSLPRVMTTA